jgi:hypothetical protein
LAIHHNDISMKTIQSSAFLLFLFFFLFASLQAQTAKESLAKGIDAYNGLKEYSKNFNSFNITDPNVKEVETQYDKAIALLDKAKTGGTADETRAARYFKTLTRYKLGFAYAARGRNKDAMAIFKEIESDMVIYGETAFPIKYTLGDKVFVIYYKDFAGSQSEFYATYGDLLMASGKNTVTPTRDEAESIKGLTFLQKSVKSSYTSNYVKFNAYNKLLIEKQKNKQSDKETLDWALAMMEQYEFLSEDQKKIIKDNAQPNYATAANYFKIGLEKIPVAVEKTNVCAKAALFLAKYATDASKEPVADKRKQNGELAKIWFKTAIDDGKDDRQMLDEALKLAKLLDGNKGTFGPMVLDKWAAKLFPSQCEGYNRAAEEYTYFGNADKAKEYKKKSEDCKDKQEIEGRRLAEERRKEQERLEIERKKISRETHFFVGVPVVPLFSKSFGGVVNYGQRNTLFEVSYLQILDKKENYFDLTMKGVKDIPEHRFKGFSTHVAYKGANRYGSTKTRKIYTGLLLGYNQRTFDTFNSEVMTTSDSKKSIKSFAPTAKQFSLMVNGGCMILKKYGVDLYASVGATYNKFNGGNTEVWNKTGFKISDAMVANRKPSYFGMTARVGVSVGFGF